MIRHSGSDSSFARVNLYTARMPGFDPVRLDGELAPNLFGRACLGLSRCALGSVAEPRIELTPGSAVEQTHKSLKLNRFYLP